MSVRDSLIVRLRIVRHRTLPPVCMPAVYRPTVRRLDSDAVRLWVLSPGEPYPGRECLLGRTVAVDVPCMFLA